MADEPNTSAVVDATKPVEEPVPASNAIAEPAVAESKPTESGVIATEGVAEGECPYAHAYTRSFSQED